MTRDQIGTSLEYEYPNQAIEVIHRRNADRLDKFSTTVNLTGVEGGREVSRVRTVYNRKGIMEICRFSRQPKADAFIDWAWEVMEAIMKTGTYSIQPKSDDEIILQAMNVLQLRVQSQQKQITEMAPKARGYDLCMSSDDAMEVGEVAKMCRIGRNDLFALLRRHGILMEDNVPYQRHAGGIP
jgi:hypothetical protein